MQAITESVGRLLREPGCCFDDAINRHKNRPKKQVNGDRRQQHIAIDGRGAKNEAHQNDDQCRLEEDQDKVNQLQVFVTTTGNAKASKYPDLETVYAQCSGPGGLKLAEFLAQKLDIQAGKKLLDVGFNRGYQSCFLAKEYGPFVVGIDPWNDRQDGRPHVDHLMDNARVWEVEDLVVGVQSGVPDTRFAGASFDYVYTSTALEMLRGMQGEFAYREALAEIYRVLEPNGLLALGEPMHLEVDIPVDLAPLVTQGETSWVDFFATIEETKEAVQSAGFEIIEAAYAPDARPWWEEYARYDPGCRRDPQGEPRTIAIDDGRWLSFGYVIAIKPA